MLRVFGVFTLYDWKGKGAGSRSGDNPLAQGGLWKQGSTLGQPQVRFRATDHPFLRFLFQ